MGSRTTSSLVPHDVVGLSPQEDYGGKTVLKGHHEFHVFTWFTMSISDDMPIHLGQDIALGLLAHPLLHNDKLQAVNGVDQTVWTHSNLPL